MRYPSLEMFSDDTRYAFAVGKIRVLEKRLLSKEELRRMLEAPSAQDALSVLMESPYGDFLSKVELPSEFEKLLREELRRTYQLIDHLSQDRGLTDIFRIRWDYHNLKVLLKASYLEPGVEGRAIMPLGLVGIDSIRTAIGEGKIELLPDYLKEALLEAKASYEESQDPQMMDITIERRMFEDLLRRAKEYPNKFLEGYFRAAIDLNNIRNFLRIKALGGGARLLERVLVAGGEIPKSRYFRMLEENISEIPSLLRGNPYSVVIEAGIQDFLATGSLKEFEKLMDNYLIAYLKPAKYVAFGVEPLIAYLIAKEHEVKLIRIIMIGKISQLPVETIEERMRESYV